MTPCKPVTGGFCTTPCPHCQERILRGTLAMILDRNDPKELPVANALCTLILQMQVRKPPRRGRARRHVDV